MALKKKFVEVELPLIDSSVPILMTGETIAGKTIKLESENENLIGKKIGEIINGNDISEELHGYELEITGTSDISGIPGNTPGFV